MPRGPLYEWYGTEYASQEKSADWFWALGIVSLAAILACILFNNFLLALVILAGSGALAAQAARRSREHHFSITEQGVTIDNALYPYESMVDFSILEYLDETLPPALSIKTNHILAPHLLIPINGPDPVEVYEYVLNHVPEGEHKHSFMDHLMHLLRL